MSDSIANQQSAIGNPRDVLARFSALLAEVNPALRLRRNCAVEQQAARFVQQGFTLEDLELVFRWTWARVRAGEGGFSYQSLAWHTMLGFDDVGLAQFEGRLTAAELARSRTRRVAAPAARAAAPAPEPQESEEARAQNLAALGDFRRKMRGGGA